MRLLVAHNWHLALDAHARAESKPYPPLGSLVIAAELRRRGHEVAFHDATFEPGAETFAATLDRARPERLLVVPDHHAIPQKMCLDVHRRAALTMIAEAHRRGIPVVVSGPDVTDRPRPYLDAGADAVVRGEPDPGLLAWVDGARPSDAPEPPMTDLAWLPPPAWDLVDLAPYRRAWSRHGAWEAPVSAARGCPYRCNWCAKPNWGRSLSLRPPELVVRDCRDLAALGADRVWFMDDIFALKPSWLRAFRAAAEPAGGVPPYRCQARADLVAKDGYVEDLAATGCAEVWMGAESGSQKVLDAMDKDVDVATIETAVHRLRERNIRVGLFLQLGYPDERREDVLATIAMVRRLAPDDIGISVSYPLPGTPFYDRVRAELGGRESWDAEMDNVVLFRGAYPQPFYDAARQAIRHEHAFWRGVRRPSDVRGAARAIAHAAVVPWYRAKMRWHAREANA